MQALTPASADDLPPLGELIVDDPFWRYPSATLAGEGVAHLRVWTTATVPPSYLAVVTETGPAATVTNSAADIRAELARTYGPSLVLLEHARRGARGEEDLDLVRIGRDGEPHWTRVWPTGADSPRHAELEAWMAAYGYQIVDVTVNDAGRDGETDSDLWATHGPDGYHGEPPF
jgi:hypothetical protein